MVTFIKQLLKAVSRWFTHPRPGSQIIPSNFFNVQMDGIGVGMASAALPFVPVFLARLGADNFQVGLITTLPAVAGLLLSIPMGQYIETRKNIVPWYSISRAVGLSRFAIIGLIPFVFESEQTIIVTLIIWALFTLPQTLLANMFNFLMNMVAGPSGRFELLSRRWSIIGITTAVTVFIAGQILDHIVFPLNYQIVFILFSLGGVLSYRYSRQLIIPEQKERPSYKGKSLFAIYKELYQLVRHEKPFLIFASKRFIFTFGLTMVSPLLPLYYVRQIGAPDSWIAIFSTTQTLMNFIGYFLWLRVSHSKTSRFILVITTLVMSFYPMLVAISSQYWLIAVYAAVQGLFEAGLNLVFFDELMKTVPENRSATFVSIAQSMQFLASMGAPILASALAGGIGLSYSLMAAAGVQLLGFFLFLHSKSKPRKSVA
jgi:MFS family permease